MSVTVYGRHDDDAVFEDDNGPARVPLRALAMLHHAADMGRTEFATWQGPPARRFHRDDLRGGRAGAARAPGSARAAPPQDRQQ